MKAEERKRKQEDRVREVMNSIAETRKIIEAKLERKLLKEVAQLSTRCMQAQEPMEVHSGGLHEEKGLMMM
ncbi:MAG: hypothetical protein MJE68_02550 [Proteobacteria bacterium]|nr:hypothetical protein [Pseudomonadota bacterium]